MAYLEVYEWRMIDGQVPPKCMAELDSNPRVVTLP